MLENYKYILAPSLSLLPLVIFPDIPVRSSFAFSTFLIIFILSCIVPLLKFSFMKMFTLSILALITCFVFLSVDAFYLKSARQDLADEAYLLNYNKSMNNKDIVIYQYTLPGEKYTRYFYQKDQNVNDQIAPFRNSVSNRYFSNYYGIDSVRGVRRGEKLLV
ncbi:DUF6056 family protein [Paenibacillus sp. WLX2291]|uniref:DUF6056 family protein n=1 Tax=Paenibacillus sp. WLX2291 TaxID=3296934 RepID=UPI003983EA0F